MSENLKPLYEVLRDTEKQIDHGFSLRVEPGYSYWRITVNKGKASGSVYAKDIMDIVEGVMRAYKLHYVNLSQEDEIQIVDNILIPESAYKFLLENTQSTIARMREYAEKYKDV